jgi:hypothetical protein
LYIDKMRTAGRTPELVGPALEWASRAVAAVEDRVRRSEVEEALREGLKPGQPARARIDPTNQVRFQMRARTQLVVALIAKGDIDRAEKETQDVIALGRLPGNWWPTRELILIVRGKKDEAIALARKGRAEGARGDIAWDMNWVVGRFEQIGMKEEAAVARDVLAIAESGK